MKLKELFLQEVVPYDDKRDPDMSFPAFNKESRDGFYHAFWPDEWAEAYAYPRDDSAAYGYRMLPDRWRGDTLISFNTVFKTHFVEGDTLPEGYNVGDENPYLVSRKKAWLDGVSSGLIACFRQQYHCLANFMPMPWGLNQWRGFTIDTATQIANPGLRDFSDLFLDQVRKFYLGSDDVHPLAKKEFESYQDYFKRYGSGEEGWRTYARRNYLEGSLVDEQGHIIFLFDRGGGSQPSTEYLLTHARPENPAQTLEFINNAFVCWERRAEVLARAAGAIFEEIEKAGLLHVGDEDYDDEHTQLESLFEVLTIKDYGLLDPRFTCALAQAVGAKATWDIIGEDVKGFLDLDDRYDMLAYVRDLEVSLDKVYTQEQIDARLAALEQQDSVHRIIFDQDLKLFRLKGVDETGPLSYIAGELCRDCLIYEWEISGKEGEYHDHDHDFEDLLRSVLNYPEHFYIPDDCKDQYSAQQLRFIENFQKALLQKTN
ncbi:hypothetical protein [Eggerthella sp. YY7918]|uniref:hypothetical protein n=1 Tax=Eggerthella sp. (strain YY7918) TaxID=502558 RepID=UPI000217195C|nr:hypothetical protein [Eggerthella sp. YY7918]BAK45180.1 parvulin-like peptidyl-prolyl isomerase [Eggerthella sp. YY7918]